MSKIALVVPRFGESIVGGAERLALGIAQSLLTSGWSVEVLSSCATDHYTWQNILPPGATVEAGVPVRRFPLEMVDKKAYEEPLAQMNAGLTPGRQLQYDWLHGGPHSSSLYGYLAGNRGHYDAVIALPYAFPMVHYALYAASCRKFLWPCLHDEPFAYWEPISLLFESVDGILFNSPEERDLCLNRLSMRTKHSAVVGIGVSEPVHLKNEQEPIVLEDDYILYVGRLEEGKNVNLLYDWFIRYRADSQTNLRLAVTGEGPVKPPTDEGITFLGKLKHTQLPLLMANAKCLCQPSINESFSLVMMESWLTGTPVIVHADCAVTRGHVERSQGGLWFSSYEEFAGVLKWFSTHADQAKKMGSLGRQYVLENYTWEKVGQRLIALLNRWGAVQ